jgi:hypothetical protein
MNWEKSVRTMKKSENFKHYCVVCGAELPYLTLEEYERAGCAVDLGGGQHVFYCYGMHTNEQIQEAIGGVPVFQKASKLKKNITI